MKHIKIKWGDLITNYCSNKSSKELTLATGGNFSLVDLTQEQKKAIIHSIKSASRVEVTIKLPVSPKPKKMTLKEVCEELGRDIEIIK